MSLLSVSNLQAGYGKFKVLLGVSVEVPRKEITIVVGPNGAGKTTLLNSIAGLATIHFGTITYKGREIAGLPPHEIARIGISYIPQMGNVFPELSVLENLRMAGYTLEKAEFNDRVGEVVELFPVLKEFIRRRAGTLSGGERRMLAIAMGLIRRPELMLLDEISADLAPIMAKKILEKAVELRDRGITILMVEQMARKALEIGDNAYLLVSGVMKFSGGAKDLLNNPELARLYLGVR